MAIKIPASDVVDDNDKKISVNKLKETISLPDGVEDRSAEDLMLGNTSNKFFVYLVNYVVKDLFSRRTVAMKKITDSLPFITGTDLPFKEGQEDDYQFSTIEYKRILNDFLGKIKGAKLVADEDNFGLLKRQVKERKSKQVGGKEVVRSSTSQYAVNTNNPQFGSLRKTISLSPHNIQRVKSPTELTIGEIVDVPDLGQITGSRYTTGNLEISEDDEVSRRQFLMHFFDTSQPYIDESKLKKHMKIEPKTVSRETGEADDEGEPIMMEFTQFLVTFDTYNYFREIFDESDFGLLRAFDGKKLEDYDLTEFKDKDKPNLSADKAHKETLGFENVIYYDNEDPVEMLIPGLEAISNRTQRKVTTIGILKDKGESGREVEYKFSDAQTGEGGEIQQLHASFIELNASEMEKRIIENLVVADEGPDITDIAGYAKSNAKVSDLAKLLEPSDKAIELGVLTLTFEKLEKINNRDIEDFDTFNNVMQTGSVISQTVGARNLEAFRESQERDKQAEKEEEDKYIVELLEDIEQNRGLQNHPEKFYEEIIDRDYVQETSPDEIRERVNEAVDETMLFNTPEDALAYMRNIEDAEIEEEPEEEEEAVELETDEGKKITEGSEEMAQNLEAGEEEEEEEEVDYLNFDNMSKDQFDDWIRSYPNKDEDDVTPEEYKKKIDIIIERFWEENKSLLNVTNPTSTNFQQMRKIPLVQTEEGQFQPIAKVFTAPDKESRVKRRRQNIGRKTGGATSLEEKLQVTYLSIQRSFEALQGQVNNIGE